MPYILTTHVGSLPRGNDLVPLLLARDHGKPYDAAAFDRLVQAAVVDAVSRQEAAGVSIVSDGELGKADRVIASTDCGFGTFAGYGKLDPAVTWKKLAALRQGADIAAARL